MKNYYLILDVSETASAVEIKKSYRKCALRWHPDQNKSADAHDKFLEIGEAYAILSDPIKRKLYDEILTSKRSKKDFDTKQTTESSRSAQTEQSVSPEQYAQFEKWIKAARKQTEAMLDVSDGVLTDGFAWLHKYGLVAFLIAVILYAIFISSISK